MESGDEWFERSAKPEGKGTAAHAQAKKWVKQVCQAAFDISSICPPS
jgi:hypothetical protein